MGAGTWNIRIEQGVYWNRKFRWLASTGLSYNAYAYDFRMMIKETYGGPALVTAITGNGGIATMDTNPAGFASWDTMTAEGMFEVFIPADQTAALDFVQALYQLEATPVVYHDGFDNDIATHKDASSLDHILIDGDGGDSGGALITLRTNVPADSTVGSFAMFLPGDHIFYDGGGEYAISGKDVSNGYKFYVVDSVSDNGTKLHLRDKMTDKSDGVDIKRPIFRLRGRPVEVEAGTSSGHNCLFSGDDINLWSSIGNWSNGAGATYDGANHQVDFGAVADGVGITLAGANLDEAIVEGQRYRINIVVANYSAGYIRVGIGGEYGDAISSDGCHIQTITAGAGTDIEVLAYSTATSLSVCHVMVFPLPTFTIDVDNESSKSTITLPTGFYNFVNTVPITGESNGVDNGHFRRDDWSDWTYIKTDPGGSYTEASMYPNSGSGFGSTVGSGYGRIVADGGTPFSGVHPGDTFEMSYGTEQPYQKGLYKVLHASNTHIYLCGYAPLSKHSGGGAFTIADVLLELKFGQAAFQAGDLISLSGTANGNDGYYTVESIADNVMTLTSTLPGTDETVTSGAKITRIDSNLTRRLLQGTVSLSKEVVT